MVVEAVATKHEVRAPGADRPSNEKPFSVLGFQPFGDDGPSFYDMLDIVNPLQHVPIVSHVYRELSGDEIDPLPRMMGGALFGGVFGAVASLANVVFEEIVGDDIGGTAIALLKNVTGYGEESESPPSFFAHDDNSISNETAAIAFHQNESTASGEGNDWFPGALIGNRGNLSAADEQLDWTQYRQRGLSLLSPGVASAPSQLDIQA